MTEGGAAAASRRKATSDRREQRGAPGMAARYGNSVQQQRFCDIGRGRLARARHSSRERHRRQPENLFHDHNVPARFP